MIDEGFNTGRKFGATGTPSAILIDPAGKIASEVAVGGPNVIALASGKKPAPQAPSAPAAPAVKKGRFIKTRAADSTPDKKSWDSARKVDYRVTKSFADYGKSSTLGSISNALTLSLFIP